MSLEVNTAQEVLKIFQCTVNKPNKAFTAEHANRKVH